MNANETELSQSAKEEYSTLGFARELFIYLLQSWCINKDMQTASNNDREEDEQVLDLLREWNETNSISYTKPKIAKKVKKRMFVNESTKKSKRPKTTPTPVEKQFTKEYSKTLVQLILLETHNIHSHSEEHTHRFVLTGNIITEILKNLKETHSDDTALPPSLLYSMTTQNLLPLHFRFYLIKIYTHRVFKRYSFLYSLFKCDLQLCEYVATKEPLFFAVGIVFRLKEIEAGNASVHASTIGNVALTKEDMITNSMCDIRDFIVYLGNRIPLHFYIMTSAIMCNFITHKMSVMELFKEYLYRVRYEECIAKKQWFIKYIQEAVVAHSYYAAGASYQNNFLREIAIMMELCKINADEIPLNVWKVIFHSKIRWQEEKRDSPLCNLLRMITDDGSLYRFKYPTKCSAIGSVSPKSGMGMIYSRLVKTFSSFPLPELIQIKTALKVKLVNKVCTDHINTLFAAKNLNGNGRAIDNSIKNRLAWKAHNVTRLLNG